MTDETPWWIEGGWHHPHPLASRPPQTDAEIIEVWAGLQAMQATWDPEDKAYWDAQHEKVLEIEASQR